MSRVTLVLTLFFLAVAAGALPAQDVRFRKGNIEVHRQTMRVTDAETRELVYHSIMRDHIHFGLCFEDAKYRRMAVTYYHRLGPVGVVLRKVDWFPGGANAYAADARLPAALTALGCAGHGGLAQLAGLWSEPPMAVIGMEAGTVAAYARPLQHFHYYELSQDVIDLADTGKEPRFFHFLADARARGAQLRVVAGSPREKLREQGPRRFYHLMVLEACTGENGEKIFLDLFTKEGIAQCFEHLVDDGILCVHISHRFVELAPVLGAIANELGLHARRGSDMTFDRGDRLEELGHFSSEWVMLARRRETLDMVCKTPPGHEERMKNARFGRSERYWDEPRPFKQVWTDKGPNLLHGVLRGHPFTMRYGEVMQPVSEWMRDKARQAGLGGEWQRALGEVGRLPRPVEEWLMHQQLLKKPRVEELWQ